MKKLALFLSILACNFSTVFAQQDIVAAGGTQNGSSGQVNFSIGQVSFVSAQSVSNVSIQQGVQQVYLNNSSNNLLEIIEDYLPRVFPNPFQDFINIKWEKPHPFSYDIFLYSWTEDCF